MPYVNLSTSAKLDLGQKKLLIDFIAENISIISGKNRENVMIHINSDQIMAKGDPEIPCLFVDVRLFNSSALEEKSKFTDTLFSFLNKELGIDRSYMYLNFIELTSWGVGDGLKGI